MGILTERLREKRGQYLSVDWENWQKRVLDMYQASSKVPVTTETALGLPAFYDCVRILAEDSAKLPLPLLQKIGGRERRQADEHPTYPLMHDSPNDEMTAQEFREALMVGTLCRGTGFAFVQWGPDGYPSELWPLNSANMKVLRGKMLREVLERPIPFKDEELVFFYILADGSSRFWRKEQVMRIHGPGFNGLTGMNPLTLFRESIGLTIAPERYLGKFFANDATPGFCLSTEQALDDDEFENILDSWNDLYRGLDRAHGVAILEKGLKPVNIGVNPRDARVFDLRDFQLPEMARIFRMPLHKMGYLKNATYTNIEHQAIEYYTDCLDPWLVRIEKGAGMSLLSQNDRAERYYWRHTIAGVLRGDLKSRYEAYAIGRQWGWLSANRVLELEDQNGIGPQGDIYMVPLNMVPADTVYDLPEGQGDSGQEEGQGRRSAAVWRILRSIARDELA